MRKTLKNGFIILESAHDEEARSIGVIHVSYGVLGVCWLQYLVLVRKSLEFGCIQINISL